MTDDVTTAKKKTFGSLRNGMYFRLPDTSLWKKTGDKYARSLRYHIEMSTLPDLEVSPALDYFEIAQIAGDAVSKLKLTELVLTTSSHVELSIKIGGEHFWPYKYDAQAQELAAMFKLNVDYFKRKVSPGNPKHAEVIGVIEGNESVNYSITLCVALLYLRFGKELIC